MTLFTLLSWRYIRRHVLRTALTTAGVVLGVAVFVGMHTANQSVLFAFSETINQIAGRTELQVTAGEAGFPEEVLETVQSSELVRVAVPVIEAVVDSSLEGEGDLLVIGIDMTGDRSLRDYELESGDDALMEDPLIFLAQPDSIIVSKELADRNGLMLGSALPLQTSAGLKTFTIRGIMSPTGLATAFGGNLAIMDIYAAQQMFGRGRTFDRIDLALAENVTTEMAIDDLTGRLGPGFDVQPPASRGRQAEAMVAGYTTMVSISSAFALFIGMFIIYNAFVTAVAERRAEIGIVRALGGTRAQVRRLFVLESMVLGLAGSAIGVGIGILVAGGIASAISTLVGELYGVARQASAIATDPRLLALALAIGTLTSVAAAAVPAWNASRLDPVQALSKGSYLTFSSAEGRFRVALGLVMAALSVVCVALTGLRPLFYAGFVAAIACALLLSPVLSRLLARALRPILVRLLPVEGALAADSLIQAPRRTSGSVSALMLSVALIGAFAGMARAAHSSIVEWIDTTLNADLFVMPSQRLDLRTARFPESMAGEIAALPGVAQVQKFRNNRITFNGKPAMLAAIEMDLVRQTSRNNPVAGDADDMYRRAAAGQGAIVAETLAQLHDLTLGDTIELPSPSGTVRLPVVGIIVDYVDQQGTIFIDRSVFVEHWSDDTVSDFRVFVTPGTNLADVRRRITGLFDGRQHTFVLTNEESRAYVLRLADQWFGLMNVQIGIAVLVAIFGIVNTLTVSITDRRRELGVLKALGALRRQIRRSIWLEAGSIAVIGVILGAALAAVTLYYLLDIVHRDAIGLRLGYQFPATTMLTLVPILLAAAFVAALWPSQAAVRGSLVEALEYE